MIDFFFKGNNRSPQQKLLVKKLQMKLLFLKHHQLNNNIVSMKNKTETIVMNNEKELLRMSVKQLRALGEENKVKRYYCFTKEELEVALQNKPQQTQPEQ